MPKFIRGRECFNRKTLRKTMLSFWDNDTFLLITKILDHDTLTVTTLKSAYTKESMAAIVGMYSAFFADMGSVSFRDLVKKSKIK